MTLIRIAGPAADPVTLEEVKQHVNVDFDDDDALLADLIRAAAQHLDGRDGALGRCLITQAWMLSLDRFFPPEIAIPLPPCQSISAITYLDPDGSQQTLDPADYLPSGLHSADHALVRPAFGKSWPSCRAAPEAIAVTFVAGFGDNPSDVPEPIRAAIRMRVAHLYQNRESVTLAGGSIAEVPDGAADLIRNHKVWSF